MDKLPQSDLGRLLSSYLSLWGWEDWGTAKQRQSLRGGGGSRLPHSGLQFDAEWKKVMRHNLRLLEMWGPEWKSKCALVFSMFYLSHEINIIYPLVLKVILFLVSLFSLFFLLACVINIHNISSKYILVKYRWNFLIYCLKSES